jgi:copper chaperone NosL
MAKRANAHMIRVLVLVVVLSVTGTGFAETRKPAQPSDKDKCPVCGMFVYKYPNWLAQIVFKDGSVEFFDGPKDLFKYYFNIRKYNPQRSSKEVADIFVTEYYDLEPVDARRAFFVVESDVYGPMGHELIPLATMEDARAFLKDHKGRRIFRFEEVTPVLVERLG